MPRPLVRTVLGDIDPTLLGNVSAHEHVALVGGLACIREPEFRLDDIERLSTDVARFRARGGGTVVDAMPLVEGRSALMLTELSRRTGVHIVASTGFHRLIYYTDRHWLHFYSESRLTELLVAEITEGMDEHCHNGPDPHRCEARAGVIKVTGEFWSVPPTNRRLFAVVAAAHHATGAPILVHTEQGTAGHEIIDVLASHDVAPSSVLLSHMDRNPDVTLHQELAERGAYLGYDWLARIRRRPDSVITDLLGAMIAAGHAERLTLGMDLVRHTYWPSYGGGPGIEYLFGEFVPRLRRAGLPADALTHVCVDNPARFLAFVPKEVA